MDDEARAPFVAQAEGSKSDAPAKGAKRDPNKPKKPKSAYLFFGDATRLELAQANPDMRTLRRHRKLHTHARAALTPHAALLESAMS